MFTFLKVWLLGVYLFCVHIFCLREHVTTSGTGRTLACSPFVCWFGDAVMYDAVMYDGAFDFLYINLSLFALLHNLVDILLG